MTKRNLHNIELPVIKLEFNQLRTKAIKYSILPTMSWSDTDNISIVLFNM